MTSILDHRVMILHQGNPSGQPKLVRRISRVLMRG
jgi:hypothetical protein